MEKNFSKREWNKAQKKEAFVEAAEKLFTQRGFEKTSIDDVAKEAKLTKRTLYQYFTSKEDLFFAVAIKGARQLTISYEQAFEGDKTALEKIRAANRVFYRFYKENTEMFKLLNYRPANLQNCEQSPHFHEMAVYDRIRIKHFMNLVEEGAKDGSINKRLDAKKAVFFAFYTSFSLLIIASNEDKRMWDMMNLNEDDFLEFSIDLLSDALQ